MSPRSDNPSNSNCQPNGRPPSDYKNDNTTIQVRTDESCSDIEEEIDPTCTNVDTDATVKESTVRNRNPRASKNTRETRTRGSARGSTVMSVRNRNPRAGENTRETRTRGSTRGSSRVSHPTRGSGPGSQTHGTHSTRTSSTRGSNVKKKSRHPSSDVEQHVPFDSCRYPDGANASLYMRPPSSPLKNRTHDRKHQKKEGSHSRQTKPNKLNLLSPLPDFRLHSVHHLLKYDS